MAKMIPDRLRNDVKSQAEKKLYQLFSEQLSADYLVFHQIPWQTKNTLGGAKDGETDFLIVHPELGILVVEVKGGNIRYSGIEAQWYSGEFLIKDPFQQATESKYSLLGILREQPYWYQRWITIGHAVAFPDVVVTQARLRPDSPRDIILDKSQLGNLTGWIEHALEYWRGKDNQPAGLGINGLKELEKLLSPSFTFKPLLGVEVIDETEELKKLTQSQFSLLDKLGRYRRLALSGCAGSGKTMLAVEKARRLSQQNFKVLLTCFNKNLAAYLKEGLKEDKNIHVAHFHGLCTDLGRKAGIWSGRIEEGEKAEVFNDYLPELLTSAADKLAWRVDAVIVDEGQDFRENWWLSLQCLMNDPDNGILYIFYDDNQKLYQEGHDIPLQSAPISLFENCRNTQKIHNFIKPYYKSDQVITAKGPEGRAVEIHDYANTSELKQLLRKQLHHLINEEGLYPEDIVVLTPNAPEKSALWGLGQLGNFRLVDFWGGSSEIFCTTINQFKGLESPVVILAEVDLNESESSQTRLYVGASRARNHLIVLNQKQS